MFLVPNHIYWKMFLQHQTQISTLNEILAITERSKFQPLSAFPAWFLQEEMCQYFKFLYCKKENVSSTKKMVFSGGAHIPEENPVLSFCLLLPNTLSLERKPTLTLSREYMHISLWTLLNTFSFWKLREATFHHRVWLLLIGETCQ